MEELSRTFAALADGTRLRILNLLLRSPLCVCELAPVLGLSQPLVSRHLAYLRNCGLVEARRQGARVNYQLNCGHKQLSQLCPVLARIFDGQPLARTDLAQLSKLPPGAADCKPAARRRSRQRMKYVA
ncbi:MAG: metalloregulator ArsR/SmtB family transcription factor [Deltaproteobacteria bacterium]|jgi:ArsR family transcriptional regulator|nr:metalloregulator ArsR/SmtB family transcription factor [Deltaproteobacteria bacterium]